MTYEKKVELKLFSRAISIEEQGSKVTHDLFSFSVGLTCKW